MTRRSSDFRNKVRIWSTSREFRPLDWGPIRQENKELVAADSDWHVAGADGLPQAARELFQRHVSDGVTVLVVDDLEVVEVERHEVKGVPGGGCVRKRFF